MKNPFHFNKPTQPEYFLGRWAIVEQIADDLYDWEGESYGIVGGHRFGKTSMLFALQNSLVQRLEHREAKNFHVLPVYISLKANILMDSPASVFGFVLHRLCEITCGQKKAIPHLKGPLLELGFPEYNQITPSPASLQELEAYIQKIVIAANSTLGMVRIALLIDEIDTILDFPWTDSLFGNLRSLVSDGDMKDFVRLILAGSGRYIDVDTQGSPLCNVINGIFLEPFTEDAARDLINRAFGLLPDVADEIIRVSGGHPFIIQYLLHYLFKKNVSSATIENVQDEVRRFFYERSGDLEGWWKGIGENGQHVYSILRELTSWLTVTDIIHVTNNLELEVDRGLKALCSHGFVIHDGTFQKYRISGSLFQDWANIRCQVLNRKRMELGDAPRVQLYLRNENTEKTREGKNMSKTKALFLEANPRKTHRLAIDEEMHEIERKLRAAEYRDELVFQSAWAVRPDDLLQLFNQHKPQIVHFSGHGNSEGLYLTGDDGQARMVTTQALKALFTTLKDNMRLVLLNACYSREQALALVESIDFVIGMKESIHDDAATTFASSFYRAIGFGRTIQEAFDQGITSLLLENIPEEAIPELLVKKGVDANKAVLIVPGSLSRLIEGG